jgi:chromosome segregation ATPase
MKKTILLVTLFLFTSTLYAQKTAPPKTSVVSPEIKELQAQRDTAKSLLRQKTQENSKDVNHCKKLENNKETLKEQLKAAKKAKKSDKEEIIQEKLTATSDSLVELNKKLKVSDKELSQLEKDLDNAEKALKKAKEDEAKEKAQGKK